MKSRFVIYFLATRPAFLTASVVPVAVGSAMGFAVSGVFDFGLFFLALFSIMLLHSGSNVANDYYDHKSRNDWLNENPTAFSGGRRYIQEGLMSPEATFRLSLFCLGLGGCLGMVIVLIERSIFILVLGVIGMAGGFFYTAEPVKLGYRMLGEAVIAFLFGILPVAGSYYLQSGRLDWIVLFPGLVVGILVFLIILINEFPDRQADAAVGKRTLVVSFGVDYSVWIYRAALGVSYVLAAAGMIIFGRMFYAGLFYVLMLPAGIAAMRFANKRDLVIAGNVRANKVTIVLHLAGGAAVCAGFVVAGICRIQ